MKVSVNKSWIKTFYLLGPLCQQLGQSQPKVYLCHLKVERVVIIVWTMGRESPSPSTILWLLWTTSSARSATLEDTSWAWPHLASWNLPDSQFCSDSKTEPNLSRHRNKLGGTPHRKSVYLEVGTPHIFSEHGANRVVPPTPHILSEQGSNRVGTPHIKTGFSTNYKFG